MFIHLDENKKDILHNVISFRRKDIKKITKCVLLIILVAIVILSFIEIRWYFNQFKSIIKITTYINHNLL